MNHDIDCDMGEDCTCPDGEEEHQFPLCPGCGERHPVDPWVGLVFAVFGEFPPAPQLEHPELGPLEI